jgi:WD40 repeat protein
VLHTPPERTIDILFIHGLGGTSLRTWCRDRDLDNLWPKLWLPDELPTARILTFGYNANFSSRKEQTSCTIGDFATDLLFRMKYGENTPERLGQVPIVIVAHSMGGLVFKKAFIQGHLNDEFSDIVSMIKAVLFLATPHRGADLAETLNKLLSSSIFGHSPKEYITELARRSPTIDDLNEAFRHHASKLAIFSFYETLTTTTGPISVMVVDKPNAVLGYPKETSTPLGANHHNVCKFTSTDDPNYVSVIGALRSVASSKLSPHTDTHSKEDLQQMADLLGIAGAPEEDLAFGRSARKQGTCEGFLASDEVESWLHSKSRRVLWAHAPPGGGKSMTCSLVIERLLDAGYHCSYFFFKYGQFNKQSPSSMLRSLAYQTGLRMAGFRRALVDLAKSGARVSNADCVTIWERVFLRIFAPIKTDETIFWVIDGVDESESSKQVVELISRVADFESHVRILVFSRPLPNITQAFQLAREKLPVVDISLPDNHNDIRLMVAGEIDYLISGDDLKAEVVDMITAQSQGSFLWASLVTQNVLKCHREEQVKRVLDSTPTDMHQFYDRMMDAITNLELDEDKALAKLLLTWAMYAKTPITTEELSEVYPTELRSIMDLNHTISQVCGQFVVVNQQGQVTLVHHSAREYLKRKNRRLFNLNSEFANEELFSRCLVTLCDKGLRRKLHMLNVPKFLPYASTSWAAHLEGSSTDSNNVLDALVKFFGGPYPLAWIQYLAMSGRLSELFNVSRRLTTYVRERKKVDPEKSPLRHRLTDLSLVETWAIDLMKLPAKFGRHLTESPALIYKCIPALSPTSSIIHQMFDENPAATLSVSGLSNEEWDDCLARVSGSAGRALRLAASPLYLAVASDVPKGTVTIWDTNLFEERKTFILGEQIWALAFNKSGSLLACYTFSQTFVWKVADWSLKLSASNPRQERAIELKFDESDTLVTVSEQSRIYRLQTQPSRTLHLWEQQSPTLLDEPGVPEGTFLSTPSCVAFNSDCTQIAVAYRSFPLSIWSVDPPQMIARLRRKPRRGQGATNSYTGDNKVAWHPSGAEVIGIYGQIFKWSPVEDTYEEVKGETGVIPHGISCSPNGQVFITMDVGGSVKIYDFSSMSLIYRLSSEDSINQILFGPDIVRFYDLRGSYCNIWEPNCLLRLVDAASEQIDDGDSTADGFWSDTAGTRSTFISFPASESHAESKPAITVSEPGRISHGLVIAHANDDGSINIYDTLGKRKHEIGKTMFKMAIEHLAWSPKHGKLAYSLTNGATTVKSVCIDNSEERSVSIETAYSEKKSPTNRGRTRQLLLDGLGRRLLVYGLKKCQVLSLPEGAVLAEHQLTGNDEPVKWQQHPLEPENLLCFSSLFVTVFSWDGLEKKTSIPLDLSSFATEADGSPEPTIDAILDSHCPRLLLVRTVTMHLNRPRYRFLVLPTQQIYTPTTIAVTTNPGPTITPVKPLQIPHSLTSIITHAIGILTNGCLVFLDKQLWVCTATLPMPPSASSWPHDAAKDVTRHFFLPHDWVTTQGLRMCRVLKDGTLLCPSKGEVAVMRGDLVQD